MQSRLKAQDRYKNILLPIVIKFKKTTFFALIFFLVEKLVEDTVMRRKFFTFCLHRTLIDDDHKSVKSC